MELKKRYAFLVRREPRKFLNVNKRGHDGSHAMAWAAINASCLQGFPRTSVRRCRHTVPRFNVSLNDVFLRHKGEPFEYKIKMKRLQLVNKLDSNTAEMVIGESIVCNLNENDFFLMEDNHQSIRKEKKENDDPLFINVHDEYKNLIGKYKIIEASEECAVWGKV